MMARGIRSRSVRCLASATAGGKVLLEVKGLEAKIVATGQAILHGVDLVVREGEVHAIMGKNGSGKSTLSKVRGAAVTPRPSVDCMAHLMWAPPHA